MCKNELNILISDHALCTPQYRVHVRNLLVRIYSAHTGKMARPVPIWNSLRPSCTIGSSCYRYIALLPKSFGVKTASLLTCDPGFQHEFPRPRPTFSQMHCNGALSGKRYPVFGRGLSRTAPGERLE